jgi:hypothetical protein
LGLQLVVANARTDSDLETAFATFSQERVGAVLVVSSTLYSRRIPSPFFYGHHPAAITVGTLSAAIAAKALTTTPIIFTSGNDPVDTSLVDQLR